MFKNIRNQWKAHPLGILLLLIGYVIGILVVSVGTSVVQEARTNSLDSTSGNPEHHQYMMLSTLEKTLPTLQDLLPIFNQTAKRAQVLVGLNGSLEKGEKRYNVALVGVLYSEQPEWQAPILNGRQLTANETLSKQHLAIMGRNLAKQVFPDGIRQNSTITINNESYQVIGLVGIDSRGTQWDNQIYVPLAAVPQQLQTLKMKQLVVALTTNGEAPTQVAQSLKHSLLQFDPNMQVSIQADLSQNSANTQIWNSLLATVLLAGLILLVACINITNLSLFWILDRRKEIGIRKALGATDADIIRLVITETMFIAIVAAFIALLIHGLLLSVLAHWGLSAGLHWINWVISMLIAILCGGITSLSPVKAALKMAPIDVLRLE